MFISTWKYAFLNGDLASISTRVIPSAYITEGFFNVYQKEKVAYIQYIKETLSQTKSNNFLHHYDELILKHFPL